MTMIWLYQFQVNFINQVFSQCFLHLDSAVIGLTLLPNISIIYKFVINI